MARRALHWLSVVVMIGLLMAAVPPTRLLAQGYPPDGLYYGAPSANPPYEVIGYSDALEEGGRIRSTLYQHYEDGWMYFAIVVDRVHNDNVYNHNKSYLQDAGWLNEQQQGPGHEFNDLQQSDQMTFGFACGDTETPDVSFIWGQDYLYDANGNYPNVGPYEWQSDPYGPDSGCLDASGDPFTDGCTGPPQLIVSSSSLAWNMNNTTWDTPTLSSPNTDPFDQVTDEEGYPPYDDPPDPSPPYDDAITYNSLYDWEWAMVYEFAFPMPAGCTEDNWYLQVPGSHSSPAKDGENVPLSVELLSFDAEGGKNSVLLSWETASEVDNLGFNVWRAEAIDGEKVQVNQDLILSKVPPGSSFGAKYEYTDNSVRWSGSYTYWLEDVDIYGETAFHGPVEATLMGKPGLKDLLRRILPIKPPIKSPGE